MIPVVDSTDSSASVTCRPFVQQARQVGGGISGLSKGRADGDPSFISMPPSPVGNGSVIYAHSAGFYPQVLGSVRRIV